MNIKVCYKMMIKICEIVIYNYVTKGLHLPFDGFKGHAIYTKLLSSYEPNMVSWTLEFVISHVGSNAKEVLLNLNVWF